MHLISETSEKKHPVLIVDPQETHAGIRLKLSLEKHEDIEVVVAKEFPVRLEHFFLVYVINVDLTENWQNRMNKKSRVMLIYINQPKRARDLAKRIAADELKRVKVISLYDDFLDAQALERIFWFSFVSKDNERLLEIVVHEKPDQSYKYERKNVRKHRRFKRHYVLGAFLTLVVYSVITFLILLSASLMFLQTFTRPPGKPEGVFINSRNAHVLNGIGTILYRPIRPAFLFFSFGLLPDTLGEMNMQLESLSDMYTNIKDTTTAISNAVLMKNKNAAQKQELSRQIGLLQKEIARTIELSSFLEQKIPHWNDNSEAVRLRISQQKDTLAKLQEVPQVLESVFGKGGHRTYLILIADTSSVKPGGGVMPYYGVLNMDDMNIASFALNDSAALDNARTTPIETTTTYNALPGQNEFKLQNGLVSADLSSNYKQISNTLTNETDTKKFDGVILVTDTGIQQLISAYSPVFLPDIKETVTPENYLIKYQIAPDKKAFISSLLDQLQIRGERTPSQTLVPTVMEALNEKQIVFLPEAAVPKDVFNKLYWDGTVPQPHCLVQSFQCIDDYIFPLQANVGDKPVNRYIEKSISQRVFIDPTGKITNTFAMSLRNTSYAQIFPGGAYRSYMQVIIPGGASVHKVTVNDVLVEKPDIINSTYTIIGFPFEIAAQSKKEIKVEYELGDPLPRSKSIYQLIFQKQIGSTNTDVSLEIILPKTATITNKNFSPVVKNGRIFYNTVLNADKLFILEIDNTHK